MSRKKLVLIPIVGISLVLGPLLLARGYVTTPQYNKLSSAAGCTAFAKATDKYNCYRKYFRAVVKEQGAKPAIAELTRMQQQTAYMRENCHQLSHVIGRAAMEHYKDLENALQYETNFCYTGYTHGIMETYMSRYADSELNDVIKGMCTRKEGEKLTLKYYNCLHGVGHGVMIRFGDEVFKSLPYCDVFALDWEKKACFNGIFMQNIMVDGINHASQDLKPDDPLYPCNVVEDRMKDPCYLIQGRYVLEVTQNNFPLAFGWCEKAEPQYINSCYQSIGTDINSYANGDPVKVIAMCSQGNPQYQGYCYGSAAGDTAYRMQRPQDADVLCSMVPEQYQPDCRAGQQAVAQML